jgi:hypothetical protein
MTPDQSDYIKQLEETVSSLQEKVETIGKSYRNLFKWKVMVEVYDRGTVRPYGSYNIYYLDLPEKNSDKTITWIHAHRVNTFDGMENYAPPLVAIFEETHGFDVWVKGVQGTTYSDLDDAKLFCESIVAQHG